MLIISRNIYFLDWYGRAFFIEMTNLKFDDKQFALDL